MHINVGIPTFQLAATPLHARILIFNNAEYIMFCIAYS